SASGVIELLRRWRGERVNHYGNNTLLGDPLRFFRRSVENLSGALDVRELPLCQHLMSFSFYCTDILGASFPINVPCDPVLAGIIIAASVRLAVPRQPALCRAHVWVGQPLQRPATSAASLAEAPSRLVNSACCSHKQRRPVT